MSAGRISPDSQAGSATVPMQTAATRRVLLSYVRPFRGALLAGALLSLATAATGLALPLVVRQLISGLGTSRTVTGLLVLMSVLVLANAGIGAAGSYLLERTAESVVLVARRRLVSHLLWL